jgi:hypothetical protein
LFISYQQMHKEYFKGLSPQTFTEYLDYLLGQFVMGLCAKDASGYSISQPSWALVVSYEHAIRSKALTLIKKGNTLKEALKMAWEDPVTKERYFTTPLCMEANKKRAPDFHHEPPAKYQNVDKKGDGKGRKGKGQKSQGSASSGCKPSTPDGQRICYKFNNRNEKCKNGSKCNFLHVCGTCFAKNVPMYECKHKDGEVKK